MRSCNKPVALLLDNFSAHEKAAEELAEEGYKL
jgi:hypothetical protein